MFLSNKVLAILRCNLCRLSFKNSRHTLFSYFFCRLLPEISYGFSLVPISPPIIFPPSIIGFYCTTFFSHSFLNPTTKHGVPSSFFPLFLFSPSTIHTTTHAGTHDLTQPQREQTEHTHKRRRRPLRVQMRANQTEFEQFSTNRILCIKAHSNNNCVRFHSRLPPFPPTPFPITSLFVVKLQNHTALGLGRREGWNIWL